MTNPENQSTHLAHKANEHPLQPKPSSSQEHTQTLDEEQLKAITGGGAVMCCMRGTPVRPTPHEPDPVVTVHQAPAPEAVVHQAPAPMGMEPHPNLLGLHIIEDHFSAGSSHGSYSHHQAGPSHH